MKSRNTTYKLTRLFITIIIAFSLTSIVPRFISSYLTTYFYLAVLILCLFLILLSKGTSSLFEYIAFIIPIVLWKALIYVVSAPSIAYWAYELLWDLLPLVLGAYITKRADEKEIKYFSILIIAAVFLTGITTFVGLITNPNASRYMATVADSNEARYVRYTWLNIGGYEFVYTSVLLYPVLIYAYKKGKVKLLWTIIVAILELLFILSTEYTTALLLWFLSTPFLLFKKDLQFKGLVIVIFIAALLLFVLPDMISNGLRLLARNVESESIQERLLALAAGREGLESTDDKRLDLWIRSIQEFLKHPLLGNRSNSGGGHSFIFDTLAKYGLIGISIIGSLYAVIYKKFFAIYRNSQGYGYIVWMFVQTILLSVVNTTMWLYVLGFYIPTLLAFVNSENAESKNPKSGKQT